MQIELSSLDELETAQHLLMNGFCNTENDKPTISATTLDPADVCIKENDELTISATVLDPADSCNKEKDELTVSSTTLDPAVTVDQVDSTAAEFANIALKEQSCTLETVHGADLSAGTVTGSCAECDDTSSVSPSQCASSVSVSSTGHSDVPPHGSSTARVSAGQQTDPHHGSLTVRVSPGQQTDPQQCTSSRRRRRKNKSARKNVATPPSGNTADRRELMSFVLSIDSA